MKSEGSRRDTGLAARKGQEKAALSQLQNDDSLSAQERELGCARAKTTAHFL